MTRVAYEVAARSRRACRTTASTGPGQKSHVERRKASVPVAGNAGRLDADRAWSLALRKSIARRGFPAVRKERKAGVARLRIERGVCMPVMACRSGCVASIQAPPALRTPLARGE